MNAIDDWRAYVRRVGPPRVVICDIDVAGVKVTGHVWRCRSHEFDFDRRGHMLDGKLNDRCPVSRLEEWRARVWAS